MRKIITLGLGVLTSSVLVFGTPIAAHAATPNKDQLCAPGAVPLAKSTLDAAVAKATTDKATAVAAQATKATVVTSDAVDLANKATALIHAKDGGGGDVTATQNAFNAASSTFSAAVSDWQSSYLAAVSNQNTIYGSNFLLDFDNQVLATLCV